MSTISSDTKFLGNGKWVNQDTGEMIEVNEVVKRVPRSGFEITYLTYFMDLFDKLGGQKYQVFKYIIENRSRDNNTLVTTNKELSRLTKTSTKTVQD
ncbi:replication/maintenance protein RepL, partial [Escherichia coli]